jgi:hypothetical protein
VPGSSTTPGRPSARVGALGRIAFRYTDSVGTRDKFSIAARWLACTFPCRRFADILADACTRLGADAVRYSFIVRDLHPLLLAGLPAHLCENVRTRRSRRIVFSIILSRCGRQRFCFFKSTNWRQHFYPQIQFSSFESTSRFPRESGSHLTSISPVNRLLGRPARDERGKVSRCRAAWRLRSAEPVAKGLNHLIQTGFPKRAE